jgi:hypothetical protein
MKTIDLILQDFADFQPELLCWEGLWRLTLKQPGFTRTTAEWRGTLVQVLEHGQRYADNARSYVHRGSDSENRDETTATIPAVAGGASTRLPLPH